MRIILLFRYIIYLLFALPMHTILLRSKTQCFPRLSFHHHHYRSSLTKTTRNMSTMDSSSYLSVHVKGKVTNTDDFYLKTLENARNSILEPGISRFDVLRDLENIDEFLLMEVYNRKDGPDEHKKTKHYNDWKDGVTSLMAIPRSSIKYQTIFPITEPNYWKTESTAHSIDINAYSSELPWNYMLLSQSSTSSTTSVNDQNYHPHGLLVVIVHVNVNSGSEMAFIQATIKNCQQSIKEGGIHRFDLLQNIENPCNFAIIEVYNHPMAPIAHKSTEHYKVWASEVENMMATPRSSKKYVSLYPLPLYWHQSSRITHPGEGAGLSSPMGLKGLSAVSGQSFSFLGPKISFGRNIATKAIANAIKDLKMKKPFIVCGKSGLSRYYSLFQQSLSGNLGSSSSSSSSNTTTTTLDISSCSYSVAGEPTVEDALVATELAKKNNCDGVLALGGGSAIDLGKVVAAMITNSGDIYDYIEVIGKGQAITNIPVPLIAVPTTSGTGSEATKNAVLKSIKFARKASMRHDSIIADIAIIDPMLTLSCPKDVTAHVGLDTLCQVIEPYVSNAANPIVDAIAKEGIIRASRSLRDVVANGQNIDAREDLAIASLLGGISLANAKLGAVHGYASVLGGMYEDAPHGAICAALLPHVFQKNCEKLSAVLQTLPKTDSKYVEASIRLQRFNEVSKLITGNSHAIYSDGVAWLHALVRDLQVPRLSTLCKGMKKEDLDIIAENTAVASSTKGNPIVLSIADLKEIVQVAM